MLAVVLAMMAAVYYHSESRFLNCSNFSEHGVQKDSPFETRVPSTAFMKQRCSRTDGNDEKKEKKKELQHQQQTYWL